MEFLKRWIAKVQRLFQHRYYNRLMLYNTLIFMVVAYIFAFIASDYAIRMERIKRLQQNRDALGAICSYYDRKHDEFLDLIFPLYEQFDNYEIISGLLESKTDRQYQEDAFAKQEIVNMLQRISIRDKDIFEILIYKNLTGERYVYNSNYRTFNRVGSNYLFFNELEKKRTGRTIYGTEVIDSDSTTTRLYGIGGTLGTKNIRREAGSFAIVYETRGIERILQGYGKKIKGRFMILGVEGQIIFDSHMEYEKKEFPNIELILAGNDSMSIDGKPHYVQTIKMLNRNYICANIVSKEEIDDEKTTLPFFIFLLFSVMVLVIWSLYLVSGSLVSRRVDELTKGMKLIGTNNLSYRIPLLGRNDEFEEISMRFNEMCDELQETINREYLSEISKKNAELSALQAGINPHFLYNTLEAIRIKAVDDGNCDVAEMIVLLASLFRNVVKGDTFIPIHKEINTCNMYLSIFSMRYATNLDFEVHIDPDILEYGIPKNLLQPIIENYFIHGIRNDWEQNRFVITGWRDGQDILFTFEDNGRGIDSDKLVEIQNNLRINDLNKKSSYGLTNVNQRIQLVYGKNYGLWIDIDQNNNTCVDVKIKALTCEELKEQIRLEENDI